MKSLAMKIRVASFLLLLIFLSCKGGEVMEQQLVEGGQEESLPQTPSQDYTELINKTVSVTSGYDSEAEQQGEVVRIDYNTSDYADGTGAARTNTAYVYLPYGYDTHLEQRYNMLYLGSYGTQVFLGETHSEH